MQGNIIFYSAEDRLLVEAAEQKETERHGARLLVSPTKEAMRGIAAVLVLLATTTCVMATATPTCHLTNKEAKKVRRVQGCSPIFSREVDAD